MIPEYHARGNGAADAKARQRRPERQAEKKIAAITGFTSAIAAFGAFFIPKSYGSSIALTGGVEAALWGFLVFYVSCLADHLVVYTRRGGLLHDVERGGPNAPLHPACLNKGRDHEPFSRSPDLLQARQRRILRRPRHHHARGPALGRRLPQALAARQDRALDPRRQLHRLVLVEDLRQGRHRHLGDPADRLSAHAAGLPNHEPRGCSRGASY